MTVECSQWSCGLLGDGGMSLGGIQFGGQR